MIDESWHAPLTAAGVLIEDAGHLIRRHLGFTEPPEAWAAPLFDSVPPCGAELSDADFLGCAALGVRVTKATLAGWAAARPILNAALRDLDPFLSLENANDEVLERIHKAVVDSALEVSVATKLLHRGRPRLVPPVDRTVVDWYGRELRDRGSGRMPQLLTHLRADLQRPANRAGLTCVQQTIVAERDGALAPTRLRLFDIALWMADHRG